MPTFRPLATFIITSFLTSFCYADSVTCHYFYNPLKGLESIHSQTPNESSDPVLAILKDVVSQHFNIKKITPEMTIESFDNYLDIIDPFGILLSKQDLSKLNYPDKSFFVNLHKSWLTGQTSAVYKFLFARTRERMDAYIQRFIHNKNFRQRILDRANEILASNIRPTSQRERPEKTSDMESRIIEFLALELADTLKLSDDGSDKKLTHADLAKLIRSIRTNIEYLKKDVSTESMTAVIAKSFLDTFDAHTEMYLPMQSQRYQFAMTSKQTCVGLIYVMDKDGFKIDEVVPGGVADKSGLQKNDIILALEPDGNSGNWHVAKRLTLNDSSLIFSGEPNSSFRMRIRRGTKEFVQEIIRQQTTSGERSVEPAIIRNTGAGLVMSVKLNSFSKGSAQALRKEIAKNLKANTINGLVIDLRGNGGGNISEMSSIVQLFASRASSMLVKDRNSVSIERAEGSNPAIWNGPLVVLVDHDSASSSETFAAALQSHKRAIIVGGPNTFGKGSMQNYQDVGESTYKVTVGVFYSPSGHPLQWQGVNVDIPLPSTESSHVFSERKFPKSLKPDKLGGAIAPTSNILSNLDSIIKTLKEKSVQRAIDQTTNEKAAEEIYSQNTEEAFRIVDDWIQIQNNDKR